MLIYSISHDKPKVVQFLIDNGFDINWQFLDKADTAVFYAIHNDYEHMLDILIPSGIDYSKINSLGLTPVYHAIYKRKHKLLDKMLQDGAVFDMKVFNEVVRRFKGDMPEFKNLHIDLKRVIMAHLCKKNLIALVFQKRKNVYTIYNQKDGELKELPMFTKLRSYIFGNIIKLYV
jgi:hypothetical protein